MSINRKKDHAGDFLYVSVREKLIEKIRTENMQADEPLPSEGSIAAEYNVSRMTGKLALKSLEEAGVIYRLNRRGSFLAKGFENKLELFGSVDPQKTESEKRLTVAMIVPVLEFFIDDIIKSTIEAAGKASMRILLRITNEDPIGEDRILNELSQLDGLDGIILFPTERKDFSSELMKLKLRRFPIVLIDRTYGSITFDSIVHAHYQGAYDMTTYMIKKGHANIGYVSGYLEMSPSRRQRYQGYLNALMDHNADIKKEYIQIVEEHIHSDDGLHILDSPAMQVLQNYLRTNPQISAVCCSEDFVALELYYAAIGIGLRIPEDLSIAGFTDNRVLRFTPVRLSTVLQPVDKMGAGAVQLMLNRLLNPETECREIVVRTEIIDRETIQQRT